ncbi:inactive polypeptide N-acetylgalactosaminyltransferase-like protein 5 [Physella acuta]|uniref:inactive polypeptide N-acetylgalactosaminyltransferase-like protein 5 n=1 Tax=Physella acuta TaxID=109671 RepID=UPI0027DD16AB|nr:inactive polypeptide N-acetylgalactosaminyltransferase-like protein 5 [Physella acuta]
MTPASCDSCSLIRLKTVEYFSRSVTKRLLQHAVWFLLALVAFHVCLLVHVLWHGAITRRHILSRQFTTRGLADLRSTDHQWSTQRSPEYDEIFDQHQPQQPQDEATRVQELSARRIISLQEYRAGSRTGNSLVDDYGSNNVSAPGEMGRAVDLTQVDLTQVDVTQVDLTQVNLTLVELVGRAMAEYNINTLASDVIPLNRLVPDSRIIGCEQLQYPTEQLATASVIIPFHNEWPSVLLRTVYSLLNRSPRRNIREIILVDDASTLENLHDYLDEYLDTHLPHGLVRVIRLHQRVGLTKARMRGSRKATGDVLVFLDSHMEVNINWLPPLLHEIAKDKTVVAMASLDYIQHDTFEYRYYKDFHVRYGWSWNMVFFERLFPDDLIGPDPRDPREGPSMVGSAFAVDRNYFMELGGYDEGMSIWGGENIEMSWRVWLCGGRLLHVPCSKIGHIARGQPYTFPGGRQAIEDFNYKRAAVVWMGNYTRFLYSIHPNMRDLDVGDVSERDDIRVRLECRDFSWYLYNVWPELNVYDEKVLAWGRVMNPATNTCFDTANFMYQDRGPLNLRSCDQPLNIQGFSLHTDGLLRATMHCVVASDSADSADSAHLQIEDCYMGAADGWIYNQTQIIHQESELCVAAADLGPVLEPCNSSSLNQNWIFVPYTWNS